MKHSYYRYFDEKQWADKFMEGELLFRSLSHYLQIEDGEVRGDANEGKVTLKPEGGLIMHNRTQDKSFVIPHGSFDSGVNTEEIFILCASAFPSEELRIRFNAKTMVEIEKVAAFCGRIQAKLPVGSTFLGKRVDYYSPADELGAKWAFPDMIAFSKVESFLWQNEYRFCFSITDSLKYGHTKQHCVIPNQPPGTAVPPPPEPKLYPLNIGSLSDICKLHMF